MPYKDPEKRRAAVRESCRRRRAGEPRKTRIPDRKPELAELQYRTACDIMALLNGQVEAVLDDTGISTTEKARLVTYMAGTMLRAVDTVDLEKRLADIEATLAKIGGHHEEGDIVRHPASA